MIGEHYVEKGQIDMKQINIDDKINFNTTQNDAKI